MFYLFCNWCYPRHYIFLWRENGIHQRRTFLTSLPKIILHTYLHHNLSYLPSLRLKYKSLSCILDSFLLGFSEDLHVHSVMCSVFCIISLSFTRNSFTTYPVPTASQKNHQHHSPLSYHLVLLPRKSKYFKIWSLLTVIVSPPSKAHCTISLTQLHYSCQGHVFVLFIFYW